MKLNPAIVLKGINKTFGKSSVLKNISGEIQKGQTVGLLGRNGEGKTTLFRIMLDILTPDNGSVWINNHSTDGSGRIRLKIGYVPERPMFHDFMNVRQVLHFRSGIFPTWDIRKEKELSTRLRLDPETRISGASKGTIAKLAWVCATAHNPEVLLLDEPTSGLDPLIRDSVLSQMVRELAEEGKTIFVANHHMEELINVLDEVWVLSDGVIAKKYSVDRLREDAVRIIGRLKSSDSLVPHEFKIFEEHRSGDFVRWAVLDPETRMRIESLGLLEQMEMEPLSLEAAFKLLLMREDSYV
jgi:ABC-2 type transport system ATP-binding protein